MQVPKGQKTPKQPQAIRMGGDGKPKPKSVSGAIKSSMKVVGQPSVMKNKGMK